VDEGVYIQTIEADAPAYKSDLRPQDLITRVDGVPILTPHDLQHEILRKKVGQSVDLTISRGGKMLDISVVTDEMPADLTKVAESHSKPRTHPADSTSYGLQFGPSHAGGQTQPVRDKIATGVVITAVVADSPAGRAGIHPGDLLTAVDQKPVADASACLELLAAHRGHAGPVLFITRGGHKASAVLDTGELDKQ
jgi:S1-C subfamily serine protease